MLPGSVIVLRLWDFCLFRKSPYCHIEEKFLTLVFNDTALNSLPILNVGTSYSAILFNALFTAWWLLHIIKTSFPASLYIFAMADRTLVLPVPGGPCIAYSDGRFHTLATAFCCSEFSLEMIPSSIGMLLPNSLSGASTSANSSM